MIKIIYFIGINIIAFIIMGWDKYLAKNNYWRISEYTLISLALLGGAIGMFLGMFTFRHKTKKKSFKILIPILIVINLLLFF